MDIDRMLHVPEYIYQPLSSERQMRILVLQPAHDRAAPIECRLERHSRPEPATNTYQPLDYIAISYVWGTQAFIHSLICDGGRLPITSTVDSMLRGLRRPWKSRRFWLDAVCLNQDDMREKRQQVPLMGEIYAEASKVKIWLGDDDDIGARAINAIRSLKLFRECSKVDYLALGALLRHPWFQRRWTIQEALLHGDTVLHFGKSRIGWNEAVDLLSAHAINLEYKDETVLHAIERIHTMHGPKRGVLSLMMDYHTAECLDHRDRIAALQGLVLTSEGRRFKHVLKNWPINEADDKLLEPTLEVLWLVDYEKDWVTNFSAFTAFQLSRGRAYEIESQLRAFGDLSQVRPELPCWVPNWTDAKSTHDRLGLELYRKTERESCIEHLPYVAKMCKQMFRPIEPLPAEQASDEFSIVSMIATVLSPSAWRESLQACDEEMDLGKALGMLIEHLCQGGANLSLLHLTMVLLQNTYPRHPHWPSELYLLERFEIVVRHVRGAQSGKPLIHFVDIATFNDIFAPLLRYRLSTHHFYVTCAGEIGISAAEIRQGDMLAGRGQLFDLRESFQLSHRDRKSYTCMMHNYDQVILRPNTDSGHHSSLHGYAVIGTTYKGYLVPTPKQELDGHPQSSSRHQHIKGVCCHDSIHANMDDEALRRIQDDWRGSKVFKNSIT